MKKAIAMILLLALVGTVAGGSWWAVEHYVIHNMTLYPKDSQELSFLGEEFGQSDYNALSQKLPGCRILWDVPFQGRTVPSDTRELSLESLSQEDVMQMDYLPELERVYAEGCVDYPQLRALIEARPECTVTYLVRIDGADYDQDTDTVTVKHLTQEDLERMQWLPGLNTVKADGCQDYVQLRQLRLEHPDWKVSYWVNLGDSQLPHNTKSADVENATEQELLEGLPALLELTKLHLVNTEAGPDVLEGLRNTYPNLNLSCEVELCGNRYALDCKEIQLEGVELESLERVCSAAACLPELERLVLVDCTIGGLAIENEDLAKLREEVRDRYKLVWKVYCGKVPAMTDDTWFMPIQKGEYYFQHDHSYNLRYCEDMVCIDLGHSRIVNVDFAAFMPHLKYLIITESAVQDISGISSCKELTYFENKFTIIRDLSPLVGCTALEDVNLCAPEYYADMTPIYQMTWLKNLFISKVSDRVIHELQEALPDTRVDYYDLGGQSGMGWRNLQSYYDMRDYLGMYYMN